MTSRDEVGQLASAFNRMVDKLEVAQDELADINRSLEDRVEARPAEG